MILSPASARTGRRIIAEHSRSFSLASRLLPRQVRDAASVVYAWCRRADDLVDGGEADPERAVARLRADLDAIYRGEPGQDDVDRGFAEVVRACDIPRRYPEELIAGMAMDARGHRYRDDGDLLLYSYRVAGTVGLMMSHVMGLSSPEALESAAHLGIAMQLTNICRDIREDWDRGRLYVPRLRLAAAGAGDLERSLGRPLPVSAAAALSRASAGLLALADGYYLSGDRGLASLSPRCGFAVASARRIYAAIGDRLAARGHDVFAPRAVVSTWRKLALVAAAGRDAIRRTPRQLSRRYRRDLPELPFEALA